MLLLGLIFIGIIAAFLGVPVYIAYIAYGFETAFYTAIILLGFIWFCRSISNGFSDPPTKKKRKRNPNLNAFQQDLSRDE